MKGHRTLETAGSVGGGVGVRVQALFHRLLASICSMQLVCR